ncbi:FAD-dependent oxidoreductase [Poseidonocella sedimentorum]|uniref:Thioredoxin reductase n=1 Tax=Poseidonocella sedimentorum TaxID=871652 RepID=A0A1I6E6B0_9RHOB|nr:FAD-dependent oxidoreductase [Poseidonocella sedimentorum]SFR13273.1 Thioredoxin reductase [Poseidonocella sedimentorum]
MADHYDIAVVGAGPAGGNAALAAAQAGLRVALLDEQPTPGGQVWRDKSASILSAPVTPESRAGAALRKAIETSAVTPLSQIRVWDIRLRDDHWVLQAQRAATSQEITSKSLILATGAREYVQPFPGWTTPGVIGLAGATALFKQSLTLPGKRTVVSGTGPLVFYVASEIRRLGGEVAAVVTPNTRSQWARALPDMLGQPKLLARGALWVADLMLARVPILWGHAVAQVDGAEQVTALKVRNLRTGTDGPDIAADSLCIGHGLIPNIEAAQILGVAVRHDPSLGGWVPDAAPDGATAIKGLYLCGDGCGIRGATAAGLQGSLTGARAARDLGRDAPTSPLARWHKADRFGRAMTALSLPTPALEALTTRDTIICRCESLRCTDIIDEVATGAASTNAVKSGRRAGMGPCGGKYCQSAIATLIAAQTGKSLADVPPPTPRPPLRPVPLGQAAGAFEYDALPISKPAPL